MSPGLLIAGLFFPLISLASLVFTRWASRPGHTPSGVYIPFIGPILLCVWLGRVDAPAWTFLLPWVLDVGTLILLPALHQEWQVSRFTRQYTLRGVSANRSVEISFHRGGHYRMEIRWTRAPGETGTISCGELGTCTGRDALIDLCSKRQRRRRLSRQGTLYQVDDPGPDDDYSLQGMHLSIK